MLVLNNLFLSLSVEQSSDNTTNNVQTATPTSALSSILIQTTTISTKILPGQVTSISSSSKSLMETISGPNSTRTLALSLSSNNFNSIPTPSIEHSNATSKNYYNSSTSFIVVSNERTAEISSQQFESITVLTSITSQQSSSKFATKNNGSIKTSPVPFESTQLKSISGIGTQSPKVSASETVLPNVSSLGIETSFVNLSVTPSLRVNSVSDMSKLTTPTISTSNFTRINSVTAMTLSQMQSFLAATALSPSYSLLQPLMSSADVSKGEQVTHTNRVVSSSTNQTVLFRPFLSVSDYNTSIFQELSTTTNVSTTNIESSSSFIQTTQSVVSKLMPSVSGSHSTVTSFSLTNSSRKVLVLSASSFRPDSRLHTSSNLPGTRDSFLTTSNLLSESQSSTYNLPSVYDIVVMSYTTPCYIYYVITRSVTMAAVNQTFQVESVLPTLTLGEVNMSSSRDLQSVAITPSVTIGTEITPTTLVSKSALSGSTHSLNTMPRPSKTFAAISSELTSIRNNSSVSSESSFNQLNSTRSVFEATSNPTMLSTSQTRVSITLKDSTSSIAIKVLASSLTLSTTTASPYQATPAITLPSVTLNLITSTYSFSKELQFPSSIHISTQTPEINSLMKVPSTIASSTVTYSQQNFISEGKTIETLTPSWTISESHKLNSKTISTLISTSESTLTQMSPHETPELSVPTSTTVSIYPSSLQSSSRQPYPSNFVVNVTKATKTIQSSAFTNAPSTALFHSVTVSNVEGQSNKSPTSEITLSTTSMQSTGYNVSDSHSQFSSISTTQVSAGNDNSVSKMHAVPTFSTGTPSVTPTPPLTVSYSLSKKFSVFAAESSSSNITSFSTTHYLNNMISSSGIESLTSNPDSSYYLSTASNINGSVSTHNIPIFRRRRRAANKVNDSTSAANTVFLQTSPEGKGVSTSILEVKATDTQISPSASKSTFYESNNTLKTVTVPVTQFSTGLEATNVLQSTNGTTTVRPNNISSETVKVSMFSSAKSQSSFNPVGSPAGLNTTLPNKSFGEVTTKVAPVTGFLSQTSHVASQLLPRTTATAPSKLNITSSSYDFSIATTRSTKKIQSVSAVLSSDAMSTLPKEDTFKTTSVLSSTEPSIQQTLSTFVNSMLPVFSQTSSMKSYKLTETESISEVVSTSQFQPQSQVFTESKRTSTFTPILKSSGLTSFPNINLSLTLKSFMLTETPSISEVVSSSQVQFKFSAESKRASSFTPALKSSSLAVFRSTNLSSTLQSSFLPLSVELPVVTVSSLGICYVVMTTKILNPPIEPTPLTTFVLPHNTTSVASVISNRTLDVLTTVTSSKQIQQNMTTSLAHVRTKTVILPTKTTVNATIDLSVRTTVSFTDNATSALQVNETLSFTITARSSFKAEETFTYKVNATSAFKADTTSTYKVNATSAFKADTTSTYKVNATSAFKGEATAAFSANATSAFGVDATSTFSVHVTSSFKSHITSTFRINETVAIKDNATSASKIVLTTVFGPKATNGLHSFSSSSTVQLQETPNLSVQQMTSSPLPPHKSTMLVTKSTLTENSLTESSAKVPSSSVSPSPTSAKLITTSVAIPTEPPLKTVFMEIEVPTTVNVNQASFKEDMEANLEKSYISGVKNSARKRRATQGIDATVSV